MVRRRGGKATASCLSMLALHNHSLSGEDTFMKNPGKRTIKHQKKLRTLSGYSQRVGHSFKDYYFITTFFSALQRVSFLNSEFAVEWNGKNINLQASSPGSPGKYEVERRRRRIQLELLAILVSREREAQYSDNSGADSAVEKNKNY